MVTIFSHTFYDLLSETIGHMFPENRKPRRIVRKTKDAYVIGNVGEQFQFPSDGVLTSFNWWSLSDASFNIVLLGKVSRSTCEVKDYWEMDDATINAHNAFIFNQPVPVKKGWSVGFHACNEIQDYSMIGKSKCEIGSHLSNEVFNGKRIIHFTLDDPEEYLYHFNVKFLAVKHTLVTLDGK